MPEFKNISVDTKQKIVDNKEDFNFANQNDAINAGAVCYRQNHESWEAFVKRNYKYFDADWYYTYEGGNWEVKGFFRPEMDWSSRPLVRKPIDENTPFIEVVEKSLYEKVISLDKDCVRLILKDGQEIDLGVFKKKEAVKFISVWLESTQSY